MQISTRAARPDDLVFARRIYYETMRWIIERLFGWDEAREDAKFAEQFEADEVQIIMVDGRDAGWLQTQEDDSTITLGQLYVVPSLQRRGIGTEVLTRLLALAERERKAVTLAVVKMNPARHLYERHGFQPTHEDEYKVYMKWNRAQP
jgi:GNAT superfamily N-acetyltransferase